MSSVVSLEIEDLNLKEMKVQISVGKTENKETLFRKQSYTTYLTFW